MKRWIAIWTCAAVALCMGDTPGPAPARAKPLPRPRLARGAVRLPTETFGNARNVRLLAALLDDPSATARQKAVYGLGQTHNVAAIPHVRSALRDGAVNVRCAAAAAAAEFGPDLSGDIVIRALRSKERRLVLTGLRSVRRMRLAAAAQAVKALLARDDDLVRAAALVTLTELAIPAGTEKAKDLLSAPADVVRLRACQNVVLLKDLGRLKARMVQIARKDRPAIRAAAMAVLGKFDYPAVQPLLAPAARSRDPLLRRGALWAHWKGGKAARIRPFLDDPSPMVVLAAMHAARDLKPGDCAGRLFELLRAVRDDTAHHAARNALRDIGDAQVERLAGKMLKDLVPQLLEIKEIMKPFTPPISAPRGTYSSEKLRRKRRFLRRDVRACCWLLGELKSSVALDVQIGLLGDLVVDSPVLADVGIALGKIGDRRAVQPLLKVLKTCRENGQIYLECIAAMIPPTVPYHGPVAGAVAAGLADLGAHEAVPVMIEILQVNVYQLRLTTAAESIVGVLPKLTTPENRRRISEAVVLVLAAPGFQGVAKFRACMSAGQFKIAEAHGDLRKIVYQQRRGRFRMRSAAWAIQAITGKTPDIPDPKVNKGDWIITTVEQRK